jgi:hypothetical protein
LAARQLYADRAAERGRQLHRHVVPRQARGISFESLTEPAAIEQFLAPIFPTRELMPAVAEFKDHPVGFLGTVSARPWHVGARR